MDLPLQHYIGAKDVKNLFITFAYSDDHILHQGAGKSVKSALLFAIVHTLHIEHIFFDFHSDSGQEGIVQLAQFAFYGDDAIFDRHIKIGAELDGGFPMRDIIYSSLPNSADVFAAYMQLTGIAIDHHSRGGGDQRTARVIEHAGQSICFDVDSSSGF